MEAATAEPNAPAMPGEDPEDPKAAPDVVLELGGQLSMDVGGKRATVSRVKLTGGSIDVDGQVKKGERLVLRLECRAGKVEFEDKIDSNTGDVVGCARTATLRVEGVSRIE
jgi:hypothetical protein